MLKKFSLIFYVLVFVHLGAEAQDSLLYGVFPLKEAKIYYENNANNININSAETLLKVKEWAAKEYKTDTIRIKDETDSTYSFQTFTRVLFNEPATNVALEWQCWQSINISFGVRVAKIVITDLEIRVPSGYGTVTVTKMEAMKNRLDSLPASAFFGKNTKARYWRTQLASFKEIDQKIKSLIISFGRTFNTK